MPLSINNRLTTFAQQELVLGYNDAERDRINGSLGQLERVLKDKLYNEAKEIVRFGSFTRNTILPRMYDSQSDVDLLVVFNTSSGRKTPGTYRKNLFGRACFILPKFSRKKRFSHSKAGAKSYNV